MATVLAIWERVCAFFERFVVAPILAMDIRDVIDVLILAVVLFEIYRFFHNRRAGRVLMGLVTVVVASVLALWFELETISYLIRLFAAAAFFCAVVIFQPEFRDALESIGNLTVFNPRSNTLSRKKMVLAREVAEETVDAVMKMAESRTGALIVFEGLTKLGDYTQTGCVLDARVSSKLLRNVFYNGSPLHDGAMVIRDMRILCANCVLPSSTRKNMDFGMMGTRHRAAVGVTEVSDALVVVVSEQTGRISVAQNGRLVRDLDQKTLYDVLMTYMGGNAYLRQKRANMRKEYLEMLENVGRVEAPVTPNTNSEAVDREFEKLIGSAATDETDASLEQTEEVVAEPVEAVEPASETEEEVEEKEDA